MHALALAHKDDSAGSFRLLQQIHQQFGFMFDIVSAVVPLMDFLALASRRVSGNFNRLLQKTFGEVFDRIAFERRREQHGLLAPAGFTGDGFDILRKAHVQHAVGFIED
ncbi:hypothetical protein SB00610_05220 [Klebsiella quasipneumoniae subsp. similipneumoniae]|nr:hypothetical protein SB00610_05220 [Klebsiella quasipneumoniae subsp. similipneumoniae]